MICSEVSCLLDEIGTGVTNPLNAVVNDKRVIVKLLNNDESNRVLINEFVSYSMAGLLSLPIPNFGVAVLKKTADINNLKINDNQYGKCFFTERIDNVTPLVDNKMLIQKYIQNKDDLAKIILFDNIIYNKDRHKGNMLMNVGLKNKENKIYMIDHTHVFNIGPFWNKYELCRRIQALDYKSEEVMEYNKETYKILIDSSAIKLETFLKEADSFKKVLSDDIIKEILDNVPNEWEMDNWDKTMLFNYISYRLRYSDEICNVIYEYISNNF